MANKTTTDHHIMLGKPVIEGTRIAVELVLRKLSQGASAQDILKMYPQLTELDLQVVYFYAAQVIANEEMIEVAA
jgi:uncharacterized protein (DUF433 family)